jgi:AraC-like DNA-binding protein
MWEAHFNFPSIIVLIVAAMCLFVGVLLWQKRVAQQANRILALALFACALHLIEYGAAISKLTLIYPHLVALSYPLLFCIAPLYYLFLAELIQKSKSTTPKKVRHFIPAILVLVAFIPFYIQSAEEKRAFILSLASQESVKVPLAQWVIMYGHIVQLFIYSFLAIGLLKKIQNEVKQRFSNEVILKIQNLNKIAKVLLGFSIVYFIGTTALAITETYRVEVDFFVVLIFAALLVAFSFSVVSQPQLFTVIKTPQAKSSAINDGVIEKLENIMQSEKPYLNSELKIDELAQMINIPYYQLSEVINKHYQTNFFDFINRNRVEEAKALLTSGNNDKILAVAFDSGFSNKATFNRIFKKTTGFTPSEYKKRSQLAK